MIRRKENIISKKIRKFLRLILSKFINEKEYSNNDKIEKIRKDKKIIF